MRALRQPESRPQKVRAPFTPLLQANVHEHAPKKLFDFLDEEYALKQTDMSMSWFHTNRDMLYGAGSCMIPVSYTHLDVYKRQDQCREYAYQIVVSEVCEYSEKDNQTF